MSAETQSFAPVPRSAWIATPRWDLTWVTFSAALVAVPPLAHTYWRVGATGIDLLVTLMIGGPHMYATFTRTIMDRDFLRKRFWFVASSVLVPITVVLLAISSYQSYLWLLSIFFALASVHSLHQLVWLSEAYNHKAGFGASLLARAIDYGVVLSSLYPIAVWKMVEGKFQIGPMRLKYNDIIGGWYWFAYLVFGLFFVMLAAFIFKTVIEIQAGQFNLPKTLLISITAAVMFWTPAFPNLDTAFQGVNAWHSFQYLALTWYANRLREQRTGKRLGFLHFFENIWQKSKLEGNPGSTGAAGYARNLWRNVLGVLRKVDRDTGWSTFYLLCVSMLPISGLLILTAGAFWPHVHGDLPGADEAYTYMGILSVLLVHYLHDALLFTDHQAIVR